jgi:hypothetical protein
MDNTWTTKYEIPSLKKQVLEDGVITEQANTSVIFNKAKLVADLRHLADWGWLLTGQMQMQTDSAPLGADFQSRTEYIAGGAKLRCTLYWGHIFWLTTQGPGLLYKGCDSSWLWITINRLKNTRSRSCQQDARINWKKISPVSVSSILTW